ncbi:hypothetical protein PMKS-003992 [Pichia membranifaciens]|uniref:Uncharacterized protein n=1 Tax=Pichia membranifaciens TaxID=4926 RepID=A0A1Q2YLQ2_9ASCO|nr:hypothetical protein PMKS-003992 [Pichia membranifaciens]
MMFLQCFSKSLTTPDSGCGLRDLRVGEVEEVEDFSDKTVEVAVAVHEDVKGLARVGSVGAVVDFAAYLGGPYSREYAVLSGHGKKKSGWQVAGGS